MKNKTQAALAAALTTKKDEIAPPPPKSEEPATPRSSMPPPSRRQTKQIAGHFDEEVSTILKITAIENKTTVQKLLAEGINYVLQKYNKPPIA